MILILFLVLFLSPVPAGALSTKIPARVNDGNAAVPRCAGHDGYDWRLPALVVLSVPFTSRIKPACEGLKAELGASEL